eukprot:5580488-Prymnesium_polylepis.1
MPPMIVLQLDQALESLYALTRRELQAKGVHSGSVVAVRAGHAYDAPSQTTQASASVMLIFVGVAALGLAWLLFNSLRGSDAKGMTPVVVAAEDDDGGGSTDASSAAGTDASSGILVGRKGAKKPRPKSTTKWGRGTTKGQWRSGGKHQ